MIAADRPHATTTPDRDSSASSSSHGVHVDHLVDDVSSAHCTRVNHLVDVGSAHCTRFDHLVEDFLVKFSENTKIAYRSDLTQYRRWCAEHGVDPLSASPADVQRYKASLETRPVQRTGRRRRRTSVARMLSSLKEWYAYLAGVDTSPRITDPTQGLAYPQGHRKRSAPRPAPAIAPEVVCALVESATPSSWYLVCAHLVMHLQVDHRAPVTDICRADLTDLTGTTTRILNLRSARGKVRPIELSEHLTTLVEAWRADRSVDPSEPALFVDDRGCRISRMQVHYLTDRFTAAARRARRAGSPTAPLLSVAPCAAPAQPTDDDSAPIALDQPSAGGSDAGPLPAHPTQNQDADHHVQH